MKSFSCPSLSKISQKCILGVLLAAATLAGCTSADKKAKIVQKAVPEAIVPGVSDIHVHAYSGDSAIYFFEYSLNSRPEDIIALLITNFSDEWVIDELTSNTLVMSKLEAYSPFWDIRNIVNIFVSEGGTVVVLAAGLDTPSEVKVYLSKALPDYLARVKSLEK